MMAATKADRALVYLLDHQSRDVVTVVIGALVNITADPANQVRLNSYRLICGLASLAGVELKSWLLNSERR